MMGEYCDYEYGCQSNYATYDEPEGYTNEKGDYCDAKNGCSSSTQPNTTNDEWAQVLAEMDADASGTISWDEFRGFFEQMMKEQGAPPPTAADKDKIKEWFNEADANLDGETTKEEFEAMMKAQTTGEKGLAQVSKVINKALKKAKKQQK